jgi:ubiquinone/menaquinone biosynthesis C-methylase UbiE
MVLLKRSGTGTRPIKPYRGMSMEGMIAKWYARATKTDMADFQQLATRIASMLPLGSSVLEVAPGPGYLAIEMAKRGLAVEAVDVSETFVRIANDAARDVGVTVPFRQGDVHALPFKDASFSLIVCRAAFKNFSRPIDALREIYRVLQPDGEALIIDMRHDATDAEIEEFVAGRSSGRLGALWNGWIFKTMLRRRAYLADDFQRMATEAAFRSCDIRLDSIGFEARLRR